MPAFKSLESFNASGQKTVIPEAYLRALFSLVLRGVDVEGDTARAYFTFARYLELSQEADSAVSAWVVGSMEIAGRLVHSAVYIHDVSDATKVTNVMRVARAQIAEVMASGSRAAPLLGQGVLPNGEKVFAYNNRQVGSDKAARRFAEFVDRNGIILAGAKAESKPSRNSAKSKAATVAAA